MRAVIQRVSRASVRVEGGEPRTIRRGLVVLLGIADCDGEEDADWLAAKTAGLRIFPGEDGAMTLSATDIGSEALVVSQFTLFASTRKGKRPSFHRAAVPEQAVPLYEYFLQALAKELGRPVASGEFGAHMDVELTNHGPVTILIDTHNRE